MHEMVWLECRISNNSLHTNVVGCQRQANILSKSQKGPEKRIVQTFQGFQISKKIFLGLNKVFVKTSIRLS